jgi:hypothetical protein
MLEKLVQEELKHGKEEAQCRTGYRDPSGSAFWFIISMALLVGFITAYPMNWWLVSRHMKHGMMTVRSPNESVKDGAQVSTSAIRCSSSTWEYRTTISI